MRATIKDISIHCGVSTATVDRVINGRDGVKARTREQVLAAATELGYISSGQVGPQHRPLKLEALLPVGTNSFIATLEEQLRLEADQVDAVTLSVRNLKALDPSALADCLNDLPRDCDGVAMIAVDHPIVRECINRLNRRNIPVVTLLSDIPGAHRMEYVGIDNLQSGRLAGFVLGKFLPSEPQNVALFTGSLAFRGHQEREMGFRQILSQEMPHLRIAVTIESQDDRDRAYDETCSLLEKNPDIAGIYNAGGATLGIAKALKEHAKSHEVCLIAHEVTDANKSLLLDGTIDACIDQNPLIVAREAVNALANHARGLPHRPYPSQLHMVFRENLPGR